MPLNIFELAESNPWWANPKSIDSDFHIQAFEQSAVKWRPGLQRYMPLEFEDYVFYTIRGPRQVGKTTFIKQLIRDLLQKGVPPDRVFFWPCDQIRGERNLTQLVETFVDHVRAKDDGRLYIFLDEITSVRNWQNSVKYLHDTGRLKKSSLVLNGSHALDIHKGAGELAGRTGKGNIDCHKMFVPMKFSEFISCTDPRSWNVIAKNGLEKGVDRRRILLDIMFRKSDRIPYDLVMLKKGLDLSLEKYMLSGGVPRAVNDLFTSGRIGVDTFNTYIEALRGDLSHWKKDTWIAKELLTRLVRSLGSLVSWNDIAKEVGSTQPTIKDYVWTLEQCFVITYLHRTLNLATPDQKSVKGKKVYFEDPFLFHAIRYWVSTSKLGDPHQFAADFLRETSNQGHMVENIVANHLIRLQFNMNPSSSFQYNRDLFYALPSKKSEIDFIFNSPEGVAPIEVKFQSTISARDLEAVVKIADQVGTRGILVSKEDLRFNDKSATIPASLFLLLI